LVIQATCHTTAILLTFLVLAFPTLQRSSRLDYVISLLWTVILITGTFSSATSENITTGAEEADCASGASLSAWIRTLGTLTAMGNTLKLPSQNALLILPLVSSVLAHVVVAAVRRCSHNNELLACFVYLAILAFSLVTRMLPGRNPPIGQIKPQDQKGRVAKGGPDATTSGSLQRDAEALSAAIEECSEGLPQDSLVEDIFTHFCGCEMSFDDDLLLLESGKHAADLFGEDFSTKSIVDLIAADYRPVCMAMITAANLSDSPQIRSLVLKTKAGLRSAVTIVAQGKKTARYRFGIQLAQTPSSWNAEVSNSPSSDLGNSSQPGAWSPPVSWPSASSVGSQCSDVESVKSHGRDSLWDLSDGSGSVSNSSVGEEGPASSMVEFGRRSLDPVSRVRALLSGRASKADTASQTDIFWDKGSFVCRRCQKPPLPPGQGQGQHRPLPLKAYQLANAKQRKAQRSLSQPAPASTSESVGSSPPMGSYDGKWVLAGSPHDTKPWLHRFEIRGLACRDGDGEFVELEQNQHGECFLDGGRLFLRLGRLFRQGRSGITLEFRKAVEVVPQGEEHDVGPVPARRTQSCDFSQLLPHAVPTADSDEAE